MGIPNFRFDLTYSVDVSFHLWPQILAETGTREREKKILTQMAFSVEFQYRVWKLLCFFLEEEKGKVRGHMAGWLVAASRTGPGPSFSTWFSWDRPHTWIGINATRLTVRPVA
jgi:hypothetical protein